MSTEEATGLQRLEGSVENIIFTNEENGYTICDMALADDEMVTVVGTMPLIGEGDHLSLYGKWVHNPKYGRQFSVVQYERQMPGDVASILRYLSSRAVKGIGPKLAQRIVEEFGVARQPERNFHEAGACRLRKLQRAGGDPLCYDVFPGHLRRRHDGKNL